MECGTMDVTLGLSGVACHEGLGISISHLQAIRYGSLAWFCFWSKVELRLEGSKSSRGEALGFGIKV